MIGNLSKMLAPIKRSIYLLIGRAIVTYVDNSLMTQRVQLNLMAGEVASDVERFEEYGMTSHPLANSQALSLFINGNRAQCIVLCVHDRRYRPTDLASGEVALYSHEDKNAPQHRIHLKAGNEIQTKCQDSTLVATGDKTETIGGNKTETITGNKTEAITGNKQNTISGNKQNTITGNKTESAAASTETITGTKSITAALINLIAASIVLNSSSITLGGAAGTGKAIATEDVINIFNNHTHNETGLVTLVPNQTLAAANMTTNVKAV